MVVKFENKPISGNPAKKALKKNLDTMAVIS